MTPTGSRYSRAVLIVIALMMAAGCSSGTSSNNTTSASPTTVKADLATDQTLQFAVANQPRSLDPALSTNPLFPHLYSEALLAINRPGNDVIPAAAQSFDRSADGLTFTFHLRSNGAYSDGQAVKAQDFVYAWRRVIDPRVAAANGQLFAGEVKGGVQAAALDPKKDGASIDGALAGLGLKAVDDKTFQVTLAQPYPDFKWIATLVAGAPVRQDIIEANTATGWATSPATLITNGVFRVSAIAAGQSITLVPNPHYRAQPLLKTIVVSKIAPAAAWTKFLNNEVDIAYPPEASLHAASTDPTLSKQIVSFPIPSMEWTAFNTSKAPFNNAAVRAAFAEAIDRRAYVTTLLSDGQAQPAGTLIPEGSLGYNAGLPGAQVFDPAKAKADLAASGVDPGQLQGLHILTGSYFVSQTEYLVNQIKTVLGVNLTIDSIGDFPTLLQRVAAGQFDLYDLDYHNGLYPDPRDFLDLFLSTSASNSPRWSNPQYDQLVQQADGLSDTARRVDLYQQAEQILLKEAPIAMLYQLTRHSWVKPWVRGIQTSPFDDPSFPGDLNVGSIYIAKH